MALVGVQVAMAAFSQKAEVRLTGKGGKVLKKAGKTAGTFANLEARDPDAPGAKPKIATKVVVKLPPGTRYNKLGAISCPASVSDAEVLAGECPPKSKVGDGSATANATPLVAGPVEEKITAWHRAGEVMFALSPKGAVGQTFVIHSKLTKKGVLTTNVPDLTLPTVPPTKVALTDFQVQIDPKQRRVNGKVKRLLTSPKVCNGKWVTKTSFTYDDGSTLKNLKTSVNCKKTD
jgi:hypothetical protein